jgi:transcriptional regulator with XRE-family HTH domain
MTSKIDSPTIRREAVLDFLTKHNLKPHAVAKKAGITSSTLYNFLAHKSDTLSINTLEKIARATNSSVDEILGRPPQAPKQLAVPVLFLVGIYGKMYDASNETSAPHPIGVPDGEQITAARIAGDGMRPLPAGMMLYFNTQPDKTEAMIGKLCVIRASGLDEPVVRELHHGSQPGLYTLIGWSAAPLIDVEVIACHLVRAITQG